MTETRGVACPLCGAYVHRDATCCPACGGDIGPPTGELPSLRPGDPPPWAEPVEERRSGAGVVAAAIAVGIVGFLGIVALVWFVVVPRLSGPAQAAPRPSPSVIVPTQSPLGRPPTPAMPGQDPLATGGPAAPTTSGPPTGDRPAPTSSRPTSRTTPDVGGRGSSGARGDGSASPRATPGGGSSRAVPPTPNSTPDATTDGDEDLTGVNEHGFFYETADIPGALPHMGTLTKYTSPEFGRNVAIAYNALKKPFTAARISAYSPRVHATITMDCRPYPDRSVGCHGGEDAQVEMW